MGVATGLADGPDFDLSRLFLSEGPLAMPEAGAPSAVVIQKMYSSINVKLSSSEFSALIALFSTLSLTSRSDLQRMLSFVSNPAGKEVFSYCAFASKMGDNSFGFHGSFVRLLAEDKQKLGYGLSNADHFWLMRMGLKELKSFHQQGKNEAGRGISNYCSSISQLYMELCRDDLPLY